MFEVGKIYITADWTIGGIVKYKALERKEGKISLSEHLFNMDGEVTFEPEWYEIKNDEGKEYVSLGSLYGREHRLYAE